MIETGRRGFLFGMGAMLVAQPKLIASRIPTIYGDGVHDDWEGLQSLMFGKPVRLLSGDTFAPGRAPLLVGANLLISDTLFLDKRANGAMIRGCSITNHGAGPALRLAQGTREVSIEHSSIHCASLGAGNSAIYINNPTGLVLRT